MDQSQDQSQTSTTYEEAVVIRVIDGDTIELDDGRRVRYIGIDTPETVHPEKDVECYGPEATVRNRELVEGKTVEMQAGVEESDRYRRLLRYVHVDGRFVNALMVAEGYAHASPFGDERRFRQVFAQLEQYSQLRDRGMWAECK
jgi:micrococcal nuclease